MKMSKSIVFLGGSGAVGSNALKQALSFPETNKILSLGRRKLDLLNDNKLDQQIIDVTDATTYKDLIENFDTAICTFGVGESSKVSKEHFFKIDKKAVLDFAIACKLNGVKHFQLLSSVGVSASSKSFYLKTKGELNQLLEELNFERLSLFQPSIILTPTNRYGISQAIILKIWPKLDLLLHGKARKYRGIKVEELGKAIANNILTDASGIERLHYDQFKKLQ
jgi:uncharacterized protein YbjT (DUF2867 family)